VAVLELVQEQMVRRMLRQQVVAEPVAAAAVVVAVELAPDHKAVHSMQPKLLHWHRLPVCLDLGLQELELAPSVRTDFDMAHPTAVEHHTVAAGASCLVVAFDQVVDQAVDEVAFVADVAFLED
jgi:hypothetical protein